MEEVQLTRTIWALFGLDADAKQLLDRRHRWLGWFSSPMFASFAAISRRSSFAKNIKVPSRRMSAEPKVLSKKDLSYTDAKWASILSCDKCIWLSVYSS